MLTIPTKPALAAPASKAPNATPVLAAEEDAKTSTLDAPVVEATIIVTTGSAMAAKPFVRMSQPHARRTVDDAIAIRTPTAATEERPHSSAATAPPV